jgi:LPS-assembly protein
MLLISACFFCSYPAAAAQRTIGEVVNIEADQLRYDKQGDVYYALGNVIITFTEGFLKADAVDYNKRTNEASADGNVVIRSENDTLEGESIRFNLSTKTGVVNNGKAFFSDNHLYVTGTEIRKREADTYRIKDATATTCDGPHPDWKFTAQQLDVTIEGYGAVKNGTFNIRNVPILYTPYFMFPAKTKRQTGFLLPKVSYSKSINGLDINLPLFWAISDTMDATFYQNYLGKRGWKEGAEFRYQLGKDSFGTFYADYLYDTKKLAEVRDNLSRDWTDKHHRWSYYLNHENRFSPEFYLRADIARVSDHWYLRDFNKNNYFLENYSPVGSNKFKRVGFYADQSLASLDSKARLVKDWENYNLTTSVKYTDNLSRQTNDETAQSYPSVTLTGINHPIFNSPVNFQFSTSYQHIYRTKGEKGHWVDANPVFSLPYHYRDYFQITPLVGFRGTAWQGRGGIEDKNGDREIFSLGLSASTEVQRIFNFNWGSIDKMRHGIKPEIVYSFIPNDGEENLPDFVSGISETNTVTYVLTNSIIGRLPVAQDKKTDQSEAGNYTYLEMLRFVISQTFDIREQRSSKPEEERRPFGLFAMDLVVQPHPLVSYRGQYGVDPNDGEWKTINHDLAVSDRRGDAAIIEYRYTQDLFEQLNLNLIGNVTNDIYLRYLQRRNLLDHQDLEKTYILGYHKQCWSIELGYASLYNDTRFMVSFSLYGLGKMGGSVGIMDTLPR